MRAQSLYVEEFDRRWQSLTAEEFAHKLALCQRSDDITKMLVSLKGGWSIVYYRVSLFVAFSFLRNIIIEFAYIYLYLNVASVLIPTLEQSPKKNIRFL